MIATVNEIIDLLRKEKPNETLVITWWGDTDFIDKKNRHQALQIANNALNNCIGHVNQWVDLEYEDKEE